MAKNKRRKCNLESCGNVYEYTQPTSKYCSSACKQKGYLLSKKTKEVNAIPPMSASELAGLISRLNIYENIWNGVPDVHGVKPSKSFKTPQLAKRINALKLLIGKNL